jgi:alpha,alpha-trehalose phosphorylase
MLHRERLQRPEYIYPVQEWRMVEQRFHESALGANETLFATGNGYLGMRGTCEEGSPVVQDGTFVNGFYESWPIVYGEEAFGFARTGQTIVNVPSGNIIKLYVDDEPFFLPTAELVRYERALDMRCGTLDREVLWETPAGKRVAIKSRRLVSLQHRHLAAISYEVTVLNAEAPVTISSELVMPKRPRESETGGEDPRRTRQFDHSVLLPAYRAARDLRVVLGYQTRKSRMTLACGMEHAFETECPYAVERTESDDEGKVAFTVDAKPGRPLRLTKYIAYHTSRSRPSQALGERVDRTLDRARTHGFDAALAGQREYLDEFWRRSDVTVRGDPALQQAIRFNLFQICQATARAEGVGIPAKGLTGEGYEGHYFWDAEIYVLPFLVYSAPRIARNLLKFRHSQLGKARTRAREVNQRGALFPWRTINGEEASAYYAAGTAQYHINADIIYALRKYVDATGDRDFLYGPGAEMLVETARLWRDLGFFAENKGGKFSINGVTGPDEYNTVVNNNTFTNLMARENLWYAAATLGELREERPKRFEALARQVELDGAEIKEWQRAADAMYVPYDEGLGIHPQDDEFLDRKPWDFEGTPPEKYPLLLHFHPLVIYRHQVIKQADVVLAMFLLGDEFSMEQKKRNFDYYDPLTTGDSSLSCCIQSIVAAELGYLERAREYARYALLMDLADVAGNVKDGCHIASMGGTWMVVVYGLGGMRDYDGVISFRPQLPHRLHELSFRLTIRGQELVVTIGQGRVTYLLQEGWELVIRHYDRELILTKDAPVSMSLDHAGR